MYCRQYSDYDSRINILKQKNLCLLCLKSGHFKGDCKSLLTCSNCKLKHHESLCSNVCGFSRNKQTHNNEKLPKNYYENRNNRANIHSEQTKSNDKKESNSAGTNIVTADGYTVVSQQFAVTVNILKLMKNCCQTLWLTLEVN